MGFRAGTSYEINMTHIQTWIPNAMGIASHIIRRAKSLPVFESGGYGTTILYKRPLSLFRA